MKKKEVFDSKIFSAWKKIGDADSTLKRMMRYVREYPIETAEDFFGAAFIFGIFIFVYGHII